METCLRIKLLNPLLYFDWEKMDPYVNMEKIFDTQNLVHICGKQGLIARQSMKVILKSYGLCAKGKNNYG